MTLTPLLITTACYLWVAYGYWSTGHVGLAWAFFGYALANCGFLYISMFGQP